MNNSQFRKLVLDTPARQGGLSDQTRPSATPSGRDGALGSRIRSSIPMTPRVIGGSRQDAHHEFARQLAEHRAGSQAQQKGTARFRSSAAPKGTKLATGYVDRARLRTSAQTEEEDRASEADGKADRVKALEEMMKLQQIDEATFIKLRDEILGGDISSTHLVKGLDYKLLERVRRGEDVLGGPDEGNVDTEVSGDNADLDDEFAQLEDQEIVAREREATKMEKKGTMAPPSLVPGRKRTRDQILADMKAARQAAKDAALPALGARFKKLGQLQESTSPRIEIDAKGREILITVDEHGNVKRKVRRAQDATVQKAKSNSSGALLMPDKDAKPLGMEIPEVPTQPEDDPSEMNIFEDAGDEYDPLAGLSDAEEEEEEEEEEKNEDETEATQARAAEVKTDPSTDSNREEAPDDPYRQAMGPPPPPSRITKRNYFNEPSPLVTTTTTTSSTSNSTSTPNNLSDPLILAALKKAATLKPLVSTTGTSDAPSDAHPGPSPSSASAATHDAARAAKRAAMLRRDDRDDLDLDMGFGSSKMADEEDFEEDAIDAGSGRRTRVRLSKWDGLGDGLGASEVDADGSSKGQNGAGGTGGKRKRGPKKRKGDVDSVRDVMQAVERRAKG